MSEQNEIELVVNSQYNSNNEAHDLNQQTQEEKLPDQQFEEQEEEFEEIEQQEYESQEQYEYTYSDESNNIEQNLQLSANQAQSEGLQKNHSSRLSKDDQSSKTQKMSKLSFLSNNNIQKMQNIMQDKYKNKKSPLFIYYQAKNTKVFNILIQLCKHIVIMSSFQQFITTSQINFRNPITSLIFCFLDVIAKSISFNLILDDTYTLAQTFSRGHYFIFLTIYTFLLMSSDQLKILMDSNFLLICKIINNIDVMFVEMYFLQKSFALYSSGIPYFVGSFGRAIYRVILLRIFNNQKLISSQFKSSKILKQIIYVFFGQMFQFNSYIAQILIMITSVLFQLLTFSDYTISNVFNLMMNQFQQNNEF